MKRDSRIPFKVSQKVEWRWLGRTISGEVVEVHFSSIQKIIKGKSLTRHGSFENPAYVVKSEADNLALKLQSELMPIGKEVKKPKIFS